MAYLIRVTSLSTRCYRPLFVRIGGRQGCFHPRVTLTRRVKSSATDSHQSSYPIQTRKL